MTVEFVKKISKFYINSAFLICKAIFQIKYYYFRNHLSLGHYDSVRKDVFGYSAYSLTPTKRTYLPSNDYTHSIIDKVNSYRENVFSRLEGRTIVYTTRAKKCNFINAQDGKLQR